MRMLCSMPGTRGKGSTFSTVQSYQVPSNLIKKSHELKKQKCIPSLNSELRVCEWVLVTLPCPTLCDPMNCGLSGSSVYEILEVRLLEWVAISFFRESSRPGNQTWVSCIAGRFFTIWAGREGRVYRWIQFKFVYRNTAVYYFHAERVLYLYSI